MQYKFFIVIFSDKQIKIASKKIIYLTKAINISSVHLQIWHLKLEWLCDFVFLFLFFFCINKKTLENVYKILFQRIAPKKLQNIFLPGNFGTKVSEGSRNFQEAFLQDLSDTPIVLFHMINNITFSLLIQCETKYRSKIVALTLDTEKTRAFWQGVTQLRKSKTG